MKESSAFQRALRTGARYRGPVVICVAHNGGTDSRIGIVVSKRFGPAVRRNRFKRIVREAFRRARPDLPRGVDVVCLPGQGECEVKALADLLVHQVARLAMRGADSAPSQSNKCPSSPES